MHMTDSEDDFIPTRRSLLSRLKNWEDQESWRDFFDTYGRLIYRMARRAGLSDAEAQDALQETLISVARQMPDFKYDQALGSFKGWLSQVTRWRIADQLRKRAPEDTARGDFCSPSDLESLPDTAAPSFSEWWEEEWRLHLLRTAVQRIKRRISPRQFQMFDLHVNRQWPRETVREALGVSAAQVYMAKMRISKMIKSEVRLLQARAT